MHTKSTSFLYFQFCIHFCRTRKKRSFCYSFMATTALQFSGLDFISPDVIFRGLQKSRLPGPNLCNQLAIETVYRGAGYFQ